MPLLYLFSDFHTFFMFYIIKYRKSIVFNNLKNSFPEKSEKEIRLIAKKFYKNLSDILLEGIKGMSMSNKNIQKRYVLIDKQLNEKHYKEGKNIIYAGGHLSNWEWGIRTTPKNVLHKSLIIYKPLKNKKIDEYFRKERRKENAELVSIHQTSRAFFNHDRPFCVIMIGDQHTSKRSKAIWVNFLNQPTACLHGIEFYARRFDMTVVFCEFRRVKRGFYEVLLDTITETPNELEYGQITKIYMNKLEEAIRRNPENWLWSHKRWKHKFDKSRDVIVE